MLSKVFKPVNFELLEKWFKECWFARYQVTGALVFDEIFKFENLDGKKIVFLNGDHFSTYFIVKSLLKTIDNFVLIWVDAHPDLNTPYESPSGNIHGMTLRHLFGDGYSQLTSERFLNPDQVYLVQVTEFDPGENAFIAQRDKKVYVAEDLTHLRFPVPVYLSIDFDVFSDFEAVNVSAKTSVNIENFKGYLSTFIQNNDVIWVDFNEYDAYKDRDLEEFKKAVGLISYVSGLL